MIRKLRQQAFTLIELMTVMAITAILLGIIIVPLVSSFNMTRTAQAFADAQDRARVLTEKIAGEIGTAVTVRAVSGQVITNLNGVSGVRLPSSSLIVQVPGKTGATVEVPLAYTKLDIVTPAEGEPVRGPNGGYINPATGLEDPTITAPKGQVNVPVVPGQTIIRYFIGLRDPFRNYNNPYDGQLMARNAQQDNLYVLYRAEVQPIFADGSVNTGFFDVDANGKPVLDDPRFFTPNRDASGNIITTDAQAERIKNWLGLGGGGGPENLGANTILPANTTRRAMILTEVSRYDMIQDAYDQQAKSVIYDGNLPRLVPMIQFRPAHVANEPAEGQVAARQGEETGNSTALAPSVYLTSHELWDHAIVRNWPRGWDPTDSNNNGYNVARGDARNGEPGFPPGTSIYYYDPDLNANDFDSGTETFDLYTYEQALASERKGMAGDPFPYPFSEAVFAADSRSGWLGSAAIRADFVPFDIYGTRGKIRTDFSIGEVGTDATFDLANFPIKNTCATDPYTPFTDPDLTGNFYGAKFDSINEKFNKAWVVAGTSFQSQVHRFIDLRVTPNADGTMGPLNPTTGFSRCSIVPGSEEVYGPDQSPGPNYGNTIRYTRTTQNPGPNQYQINYTDLAAEPADYMAIGVDPSLLAGFNPNVYDATNFVSAVVQPRFKKGYIKLNSDPNAALPPGQFKVAYRFQFNSAGGTTGAREDVFAVDYDTRQLIDVLLTMRNYPQSTLPNPQTVTLKSTAAVRNYVR